MRTYLSGEETVSITDSFEGGTRNLLIPLMGLGFMGTLVLASTFQFAQPLSLVLDSETLKNTLYSSLFFALLLPVIGSVAFGVLGAVSSKAGSAHKAMRFMMQPLGFISAVLVLSLMAGLFFGAMIEVPEVTFK